MNARRLLPLVVVALTAVALIGPAGASATEWLHEGEPFEEPVEIGLTGVDEVSVLGTTFACPVHTTIATEGGSTGQLTSFESNAAECEGSGTFGTCKPTSRQITNLPRPSDPGENELTITGVQIFTTFTQCPFNEAETTVPNFTATLETSSMITNLEVHAGIKTHTSTPFEPEGGFEGEYHAWLEVDEPNSGTYGIG